MLGWGLSESGKLFSSKKQDKRKLKRLLFYLLELRFYFAREHSLERGIELYFSNLKDKLTEKLGITIGPDDMQQIFVFLKPTIHKTLTKVREGSSQFELLEKNIDKVLDDLSEIFPIFAYELSGQHKIKERLSGVSTYIDEVETVTDGEMPFDIKNWMTPKLTSNLLKDMDKSILRIAERIDSKTRRQVADKITDPDLEAEDPELDEMVNAYLDKIKESMG